MARLITMSMVAFFAVVVVVVGAQDDPGMGEKLKEMVITFYEGFEESDDDTSAKPSYPDYYIKMSEVKRTLGQLYEDMRGIKYQFKWLMSEFKDVSKNLMKGYSKGLYTMIEKASEEDVKAFSIQMLNTTITGLKQSSEAMKDYNPLHPKTSLPSRRRRGVRSNTTFKTLAGTVGQLLEQLDEFFVSFVDNFIAARFDYSALTLEGAMKEMEELPAVDVKKQILDLFSTD